MAEAQVDYSALYNREQTFLNWPYGKDHAREMALAGFYYTGSGTRVECYACGVILDNWRQAQVPMLLHRQETQYCPVVEDYTFESRPTGNLRDPPSLLGHDESASVGSVSVGGTTDSGYGGPMYMERTQPRWTTTAISLKDNPIPCRDHMIPGPRRYRDQEERIKSFQAVPWPPHKEATPERLAKAGFFYVGAPDRVKCAFCGGKLKKWRSKDVPVEVHIRQFPECSFVRNIERQTTILAKNIRSKKKTDDCISSEELKRQYEQKRVSINKSKPGELIQKTLKKMNYKERQIQRAQLQLREKGVSQTLETYLYELHQIEKQEFLNLPAGASADEGMELSLAEGDEEETEAAVGQGDRNVVLSVDESVDKLQHDLKAVTTERDELTHQMTCKVCLVNKVDTLFLTCRHFVTCKSCADRVKDCPLCRQLILGTVDVYMG